MEPITTSRQDFLVRWLAHLSERSVRLHHYLTSLAVEAPRVNGKPPSIVTAMLHEVEGFAENMRKRGKLASRTVFEGDDVLLAYKNCVEHVRSFLKLHGKLSHFPRDWVRSEVELFLNSIGSAVNPAALNLLLHSEKSLLERYSVVTTPIYNFANLLDDKAHQGRVADNNEMWGAGRDLLTIPAVEQHNTLFWPILVHELAHSIYRSSGVDRDKAILEFIRNDIGNDLADRGDSIAGWWLEEIFCDLFAAAVTGPIYGISLTLFALFWVPDPIKVPAKSHPSPDTRLRYICAFLKQTNPEFMAAVEPELNRLLLLRGELDFEFARDDVQAIHQDIRAGLTPPDEKIGSLANRVARSSCFREITEPCYKASLRKLQMLQDRIARGEFIGTSRNDGLRPQSVEEVVEKFSLYAAGLAEKPNSVLDILTATACYQARLLLDKSQYSSNDSIENDAQFPTIYIQNFLCGNEESQRFIVRAAEFIHDVDATAIKSLEGSELARFYLGEP
jgi:hypothetical protein